MDLAGTTQSTAFLHAQGTKTNRPNIQTLEKKINGSSNIVVVMLLAEK